MEPGAAAQHLSPPVLIIAGVLILWVTVLVIWADHRRSAPLRRMIAAEHEWRRKGYDRNYTEMPIRVPMSKSTVRCPRQDLSEALGDIPGKPNAVGSG